ncbi:MAG: hypothetical protein U0838_04765 [Chloroflexota bacterium]
MYEGLTFGNPGMVAAMAVLASLAAAGQLGAAGQRGWVAATVLGIVAVGVVIISGTRSAWLAVAATVGAGVLLALAGGSGRRALGAIVRTTRGKAAIGLVVLAGFAAAVVLGRRRRSRAQPSGGGGRTRTGPRRC